MAQHRVERVALRTLWTLNSSITLSQITVLGFLSIGSKISAESQLSYSGFPISPGNVSQSLQLPFTLISYLFIPTLWSTFRRLSSCFHYQAPWASLLTHFPAPKSEFICSLEIATLLSTSWFYSSLVLFLLQCICEHAVCLTVFYLH